MAATDGAPADFAMEGRPLPKRSIAKICIPTTAGTGSEFSSTNIFTNDAGRKVWVWGAVTKPERVILDPELTVSLPAALTAWTGLDAFVHALEASTNVRRHAWNDLYAHAALGLIAGALETAVRESAESRRAQPHAARRRLCRDRDRQLLGRDGAQHLPCPRGARTGPPWARHGAGARSRSSAGRWRRTTAPSPRLPRHAGWRAMPPLCPGGTRSFLTRCGVERRLPPAFKAFSAADLAAEMRAPETQYMRRSTAREVSDADIDRFAAAVMALA